MKKDRKLKKEQLSERDSEFSEFPDADIDDSVGESEDNYRPSARNIENVVYNRAPSMVFSVEKSV